MKTKIKSTATDDNPRQIEAAKTSRLRALRLAKEAAAKEAAAREAAANPGKSAKRSVRASLRKGQPGSA
jgi:hypothetical protein